ncbi:hypothetical protein Cni_G14574 [Canna indica]|uniref:Jacalin-type lectin domain-containing protein n=1 Tax=Canna indica TaxID=4628 RepID=A0AAQ3KFC4_9LILI|nr:hypothetical protein Cni_G14574 [Canna indica]
MRTASKSFSCWEFCHWITSCMRSRNLEPVLNTTTNFNDKIKPAMVTLGPSGNSSGANESMPARPDTQIIKIIIRHVDVICAIRILYRCNGKDEWTKWWGDKKDTQLLSEINLDEDEYLTSIYGSFNAFDNFYEVIRSLTFVSNKKTYGPYGSEVGVSFKYDAQQGRIVGFFGHVNKYLLAIGVYIVA